MPLGEDVALAWLIGAFPAADVRTETDANLAQRLPTIKVAGIGGGQRLTLAAAVVDVECYAATRPDAKTLAGQVHQSLLFQMRGLIAGASVTGVQCESYPTWRPYADPNMRKFGAAYRIYFR